jgi:hypothetical protein
MKTLSNVLSENVANRFCVKMVQNVKIAKGGGGT